jgi:hypothetical protein
MYAQGNGVFVIDGDLEVAGSLAFYAADAYTTLIVRGSFRAENFVQGWDSQFAVRGIAQVRELVYLDPSDAGFSVFEAGVKSKYRYVRSDSEPYLGDDTTGVVLSNPIAWSAAYLAALGDKFDNANDIPTMGKALLSGLKLVN